MGFNIIDKSGKHIGWTLEIFDVLDTELTFQDDTIEISEDIEILKSIKISEIKNTVNMLINNTDWQLQRSTERDSLGVELLENDTPKAILGYREAIRRANNRAEAEVKALENIEDINNFTWEVLPEDYPDNKSLTHLEFLRRFTLEERISIIEARGNNSALADYMQMLNIAKYISLTDPDVISGINTLEAAGIISVGRANEILTGVIE